MRSRLRRLARQFARQVARPLPGVLAAVLLVAGPAAADTATERRWMLSEFQPSTLSQAEQAGELAWFAAAAAPFRGLALRIASETTPAHEYEGKVLAVAFAQITGIAVAHDLLREDQAAEAETRALGGGGDYDALIVDADSIGTLATSPAVVDLDAWMDEAGRQVTDPRLQLDDLIGPRRADGHPVMLPLTRYPLLYWFRKDWFEDADLARQFRARYGYDLGVPQSWAAYRDIAAFFTRDVANRDGHPVFGHADGGFSPARQGWRTARDWTLLAGATPCTNGTIPVSIAALATRADWLAFAPPGSLDLSALQAATLPARGRIAQMLAWDTAFAAEFLLPTRQVQGFDGTPLWRVAPAPGLAAAAPAPAIHASGAVLLRATPSERSKAAWLYAQFLASRTVSLKTALISLSVVRASDLDAEALTGRAPFLGGLVEALRAPAVRTTIGAYRGPADGALASSWSAAMIDAASGMRTPAAAAATVDAAQSALAGACNSSVSQPLPARTLPYADLVRSWK